MAFELNDQQIAGLLAERKVLPADFRLRLQMKAKRGHREQDLDVVGDGGNRFRLILRQSLFDPVSFSVILGLCIPKTNVIFRLRRYNGKSHPHTNPLERQNFYAFHIHTATERYQKVGFDEEVYAEPTDRFSDFHGAIQCMLDDCGFDASADPQTALEGV